MPEVLARGSREIAAARPPGAPVVVDGCRSKAVAREGSFRVYYTGAAGAVPFKWEASPGTPKHPSAPVSVRPLPPLTPPPSYLSPAGSIRSPKLLRGRHRSSGHDSPPPSGLRIVAGLVPKLLWKKSEWHRHDGSRTSSSPRSILSWSKSASSSSSSTISSPSDSPVRSCGSSRRTRRARSRFSSFSSTGTSLSAAVLDEEAGPAQVDRKLQNEGEGEDEDNSSSSSSPTSGSGGWRKSDSGTFSGCSANVAAVKRALRSVVVRAHGSSGAAPRRVGGSC